MPSLPSASVTTYWINLSSAGSIGSSNSTRGSSSFVTPSAVLSVSEAASVYVSSVTTLGVVLRNNKRTSHDSASPDIVLQKN